jgi:cytochrome c2
VKTGRPGRALVLAAAAAALALAPGPADAQSPADAARGERLFAAKQCAHCHQPQGGKGIGPALEGLRQPQGAYALTGRFWNHAPAMYTLFTQEGLRWPDISPAEMADLMAYLRADPAHDPAPDVRKGQHLLVNKGCLKCHSFHKEGARVARDLADLRADYAPPAKWAATVWGHTPRIAAKALERGILYPRFSGDEMIHLLGFLRSGEGGR